MADINSLEAERQRLLSQRAALAQQALAGDSAAIQQIRQINIQLAAVVTEIESLLQPNSATAAGELADSAGSATQAPALPATNVSERLNTQQAAVLAGETETGTNPPVKKLIETQSVSPDDSNADPGVITSPYYAPGTGASTADPAPPTPGGAPGVGTTAESDGVDGADATNIRQIISNFDNTVFLPRDNVLDQYASYTYNIGWYLMSPANYRTLLITKKPNIATYSLLAQSGGAPTGTEPSNAGGARNEFFSLDYYIDDLEITSVVTGKGSMRAHNYQELSFSIIEPAGITLIPALQQAVDAVNKTNGVQYQLATYCLVIKFYGYNDDGKMVQAGADNNGAVVEKFIPFYIKDIKFRIENKLVQYNVTASAINYYVGLGTAVGTIKAPIEISGTTVGQVLSGPVLNGFTNTTQSAPSAPVDFT